mmetsp:Transcript_31868/g.88085  ORF Transcript_31868/g.88085 Transcript_31868/m.88085 type:complete len:591 (+) Transcript_31868:523-2295(+)
MLDEQECGKLLRELHLREGLILRCTDQEKDVRERRQRAINREGRAPRLVASTFHRHCSLLLLGKALQIDVDFEQCAQECQKAYPRACNREQRSVAVRNQRLVELREGIVRIFFRLLLGVRHIREFKSVVALEVRDDVLAFNEPAAVNHPDSWHEEFHPVLHHQSEEYEDRKLRLDVDEAIIVQAIQLQAEPIERVVFEVRDVIQHEVRVDELEAHDLRQLMPLVLGPSPVILLVREEARYPRQDKVHELHGSRHKELVEDDPEAQGSLVARDEQQENDEDEHHASEKDDGSAHRVFEQPFLEGVVALHLRCHGVDARLSPVLGSAWLKFVHEVKTPPAQGDLRFLSPPEVRQECAPDRQEYAKGQRRPIVRGAADHVDELLAEAHDADQNEPLPIETKPQEVERDLVAEVVAHLHGVFRKHQDPLAQVPNPVHFELVELRWLVEGKVRFELFLVQKLPDVDAGALLVVRRNDVVDDEDLVQRSEYGIIRWEVVLRVRLVNVRHYTPVCEVEFRPAWEVVSVLRESALILRFQLQLVLHPGSGVLQLLDVRTDLADDFVAIAAVKTKTMKTAVLQTLQDGFPPLLPHVHRA